MRNKIQIVACAMAFLVISSRRTLDSPMVGSLPMEFTEETVEDHPCSIVERQLDEYLYHRLTGREVVDFNLSQASALCAERSSYQKILEKYRILARSVAHEI